MHVSYTFVKAKLVKAALATLKLLHLKLTWSLHKKIMLKSFF